ncbi:NAD(P)/FAD-dependent oxidoreductase [Aldersonia sp. NBC_00410]|uniref:phytoene desaturase family protein n=1 Tax=Aldersonia sp. NBC_00410 TaxID=2975954 RepID=UPI00224FB30D|nr:NAD(P)/FAD-dependent oxidoreductase [Aldersonia sp. NBC_00410]MCX5043180.1 NAD(P)/FAD-dependent oxidoreductase [Aldersonia sp. NBC_00410]
MTLDAVVVGAGPNGLSAAVTLARAGLHVTVLERADEIGGGTRTAELTRPGVLHDICSAAHPFAASSPVLSGLPLHEFGLRWRYAEIDVAHPLDDGTAALLWRSLDATAEGLGRDGDRWRRMFGPLLRSFDDVADDALGPLLRVPSHPLAMAKLGVRSVLPAMAAARLFRTEAARALFVGFAAHSWRPLREPMSSALGAMLVAATHRHGWPVAEGGSIAITRALAGLLESLGGTIVTGTSVTRLADLPKARVTLFDTSPGAVADILGDRIPVRRARGYRKYRYGPAAYKLDLAVRDGIPWTATDVRRAGAIHIGGTAADIAAAESQTNRGIMPDRPFLLVGQQYLADPGRSAGDVHPIWIYAHVPHGYRGDATETVLAQVERYAPGFRDRIVASSVMTPGDFEAYNPNYVGGDIVGGNTSFRQLMGRPVFAADPYAVGVPGMFLCSASTPPGAGTHGMCGYHAATRALRYLGK